MQKLLWGLIGLVFVAVIGGFIFLAAWEMPKVHKEVEKVVPNERFFANDAKKTF